MHGLGMMLLGEIWTAMSGKQEQQTPLNLIVGIGASAGGLEAFKSFFAHLPPDSGMAFVLVQHLSPDHESLLTEILAKDAPIPVVEAKHDMRLEPNRVHVIPPDATLTIEDSRLLVVKPAPPRSSRRPIDSFFASLAKDQEENAVSIILSGVGSDGSVGLAAVKEAGGLTIAQAESITRPWWECRRARRRPATSTMCCLSKRCRPS